jgi:hypothetical protein
MSTSYFVLYLLLPDLYAVFRSKEHLATLDVEETVELVHQIDIAIDAYAVR